MKSTLFTLRTAAIVAAASLAIAVTGCGSSEAAPVSTTPSTGSPVTAILVHGASADGSSWSRVTPLLQQPGPVVLVGHSYGGAVITEAGNDSKVTALVYVAAFAPGDGESINDLISPYPAGAWQAGLAADSAGYLRLSTAAYQRYFAVELGNDESAVLASSQAPIFNHVLQDKVSSAAWKTKPSYWAVSGADQIIPAAFQQGEAARIKAKVTVISDGGHLELLSHPKEVAAVILDAAAGANTQ